MAIRANARPGWHLCRQCMGILLSGHPVKSGYASRAYPRSKLGRRHASTDVGLSQRRPFRLGIIGSGPAGFYAAARIIQKSQDALVDMYEKLPAPFGLVRYGVAPDHPEVKNCQERFEEVASSPRFTFIGNVSVGEDIPLWMMKSQYDALLFAYGAAADRTLGIPGEELSGVHSARAFVGWYNGLPECSSMQPDLESDDTAYVIGNGNVALDVARILLTDLDVLRKTDIAEHAVDALSRSRVRHVKVCGRRGPMQASFTIKEVRELLTLKDLGFEPIDPELLPQPEFISSLPRLEQRKYRLSQLLAKGSSLSPTQSSKSWELKSLMAPAEFKGSDDRLTSIAFASNEYDNFDERFNPSARVHATKVVNELPVRLAFRSIGYKSTPMQGLAADLGVSFNERSGIIPNDLYGRVLAQHETSGSLPAVYVAGCYCTGWVKRGPTGVIASTMEDAFASADAIMQDWDDNAPFLNDSTKSNMKGSGRGWEGVLDQIKANSNQSIRPVSWDDWQKIDKAEQRIGSARGKPREKFPEVSAMLSILD